MNDQLPVRIVVIDLHDNDKLSYEALRDVSSGSWFSGDTKYYLPYDVHIVVFSNMPPDMDRWCISPDMDRSDQWCVRRITADGTCVDSGPRRYRNTQYRICEILYRCKHK